MNPLTDEATLARFWAKVVKTDTCWLWTASKRSHGYGAFVWREDGCKVQGRAHVFSFRLHGGVVAPGLRQPRPPLAGDARAEQRGYDAEGAARPGGDVLRRERALAARRGAPALQADGGGGCGDQAAARRRGLDIRSVGGVLRRW